MCSRYVAISTPAGAHSYSHRRPLSTTHPVSHDRIRRYYPTVGPGGRVGAGDDPKVLSSGRTNVSRPRMLIRQGP